MGTATMTLLLARHGRTAWNDSGRYQGHSDPPLSAEGESDASALAARLAGEPFSAIVSSPLQRAWRTAQIVAARAGVAPVRVEPRLVEIGYGAWEGLTQAEVKARWPEQMRLWKREPEAMCFPGGETLADARTRLRLSLVALARWTDHRTCLVVTHSGLIRLALLMARGLSADTFRHIPVAPCDVARLALHIDPAGAPNLTEIREN